MFGRLLVAPPRVLEAPPHRSMQAKVASLVKGAKWQPGVADAALHIQHVRCGHVSGGGQTVGAGGSGQVARVRRDFFLDFLLPASLLEGPITKTAVPAKRPARARLRPEMNPLAIAFMSIRASMAERRAVPTAQVYNFEQWHEAAARADDGTGPLEAVQPGLVHTYFHVQTADARDPLRGKHRGSTVIRGDCRYNRVDSRWRSPAPQRHAKSRARRGRDRQFSDMRSALSRGHARGKECEETRRLQRAACCNRRGGP